MLATALYCTKEHCAILAKAFNKYMKEVCEYLNWLMSREKERDYPNTKILVLSICQAQLSEALKTQ